MNNGWIDSSICCQKRRGRKSSRLIRSIDVTRIRPSRRRRLRRPQTGGRVNVLRRAQRKITWPTLSSKTPMGLFCSAGGLREAAALGWRAGGAGKPLGSRVELSAQNAFSNLFYVQLCKHRGKENKEVFAENKYFRFSSWRNKFNSEPKGVTKIEFMHIASTDFL